MLSQSHSYTLAFLFPHFVSLRTRIDPIFALSPFQNSRDRHMYLYHRIIFAHSFAPQSIVNLPCPLLPNNPQHSTAGVLTVFDS